MSTPLSNDLRGDVAAQLYARFQTSGLGQTLAWCRAHPERQEAILCQRVLASLGAQFSELAGDPIRELQQRRSVEVLTWSAAFRGAVLKLMGSAA